MNRRQLLHTLSGNLAGAALATLLSASAGAHGPPNAPLAPRARRVIWLFMHGGPSQLDLLDYKPQLRRLHGQELPAQVRGTQRLTGMTSDQASKPVAASLFGFQQHGQSGSWISELLPHTAGVVDELCIVRSLHTEAINHDPAVTLLQTGHQQPGRPSFGAWASYGLGSETEDLPAFVVLVSRGSAARPADPLYARLWGAGFLPSSHQGVALRASGDPVLYLANPPDVSGAMRRDQLDALARLNGLAAQRELDPEIATRIAQYEMAFRMQASVPSLTDLSDETEATFDAYGPAARQPGTFAANCLLARRMAERGVRFIQLYHRGWDQHYNLPSDLRLQCGDVDQPCAALIRDLRQRGLLDDTLIVWGGEFGRTVYSQGKLDAANHGRDHHGRSFTVWLAGGGIRGGLVHGETDDFSFNVVHNPVHVHDLNATLLHLLGIDHRRLTYRFQGRDYRLTDVGGNVVREIVRS
ncbi:MAG: DUF1501 domain-containing protein [Pirellulaceae bacterium]|nr:DUF1501 domain-containing protein [Pirellulaceae bacterium]